MELVKKILVVYHFMNDCDSVHNPMWIILITIVDSGKIKSQLTVH